MIYDLSDHSGFIEKVFSRRMEGRVALRVGVLCGMTHATKKITCTTSEMKSGALHEKR